MQAIARMQHRAMVPRRTNRFVHPQSTANKKVYASRQYVKKVVKGLSETKHHEVSVESTVIPQDAPIVQVLTNISNGDEDEGRDGDMLDPVSLEIRYSVKPNDATFPAIARVIVFQWQADASDGTPDSTEILDIDTTLNTVNSPYVASGGRKNFRILYDRRHALSTTDAGNIKRELGFIRITSKRLARIYYDGATLKKGHIYLLATSNQATADTEPDMSFVSQIKYKDL